jgi:hypothetical protein
MAQTKRKRRTKHRGNAAGMVEVRGRTGRRPEPAPKTGRAARLDRFNRPPSWRSAANRAGIATVLFIVAVILLFKQPIASALAIGAFMFLLYTPLGYYTDMFVWRRRQKAKARAAQRPEKDR